MEDENLTDVLNDYVLFGGSAMCPKDFLVQCLNLSKGDAETLIALCPSPASHTPVATINRKPMQGNWVER